MTMDREAAMARRIEIRNLGEDAWEEHGWELGEEMDRLNLMVGLQDCKNCDRDYDINYPDEHCPMCIAESNGAEWDWEPTSLSNGLRLPRLSEEPGTFIPWCKEGIGEMRCMWPEGHIGRHRFMVEW